MAGLMRLMPMPKKTPYWKISIKPFPDLNDEPEYT
jgi:hypothetical protein